MQDHILVVDDDRQETSFLERFFRKNGYEATGVYTAGEMFDYLEKGTADLVVLDLILPDEDGLEAARKLQRNNDIPIIIVSLKLTDRKSTRLKSSHPSRARMPSSA